MRTLPIGPSVELPTGSRTVKGCAEMTVELHANPAIGAFGGAPDGATNRVRGAPKGPWNCMRSLPLRL
eukprot:4831871-Pyramimonas_sp.AAC.1